MFRNAIDDLSFGLPDEIEEMRQTVARWVDDKLVPRANEIDRSNDFPEDLWPELGHIVILHALR